jgi:hypothetical protein
MGKIQRLLERSPATLFLSRFSFGDRLSGHEREIGCISMTQALQRLMPAAVYEVVVKPEDGQSYHCVCGCGRRSPLLSRFPILNILGC